MGINQEDFVKAFVGALGEERVVKKLDDVICQRLVKEIQELRDVIKERDSRITDLEKEVTSLKEALDQQEQYTRRNNLRITGIKEKETEDVAEMSMDLINKNVCELEPITIDDVDRVHRVGRRRDDGVPRPILIRFSTYRARQRVYTNRRKLNLRQRQGIPGRPWAGMTESGASNVQQQVARYPEHLCQRGLDQTSSLHAVEGSTRQAGEQNQGLLVIGRKRVGEGFKRYCEVCEK
ncbi:hypothetical protein Pmani_002463 [Petrolisthes manimaculis]|uniref:Uncharacterized protein n=1 Tax=Petrolisthes manimaculis TaxID=1843537 RepID=A0AAE1QK86_9EUCA|nr:hypothetical protein Pmani_031346 [Petrolisthes manimaculis]KAK4327013.1 hypothetical protein Pmani_002463 [Petrolisthes manimaculis]